MSGSVAECCASESWSQPCPNALPNAHTPTCFQAKTMLPTHCVNFNSVATSQPFRSGSQAFQRKVSASDMLASTIVVPYRFLQWDVTRNEWLESAWLDRVVCMSLLNASIHSLLRTIVFLRFIKFCM